MYINIFIDQWNIDNLSEVVLFFTYCLRTPSDMEVLAEFAGKEKLRLFIESAIPRIQKRDREACSAVLKRIDEAQLAQA